MSFFEKKPLDVEKRIKHYSQFKDTYLKSLIKISTKAYLNGLKELPQPINKKDLKYYMRGYVQGFLKTNYNKEGLTSSDDGIILGTLGFYEGKKQLEPYPSFILKIETILKKMEESDHVSV